MEEPTPGSLVSRRCPKLLFLLLVRGMTFQQSGPLVGWNHGLLVSEPADDKCSSRTFEGIDFIHTTHHPNVEFCVWGFSSLPLMGRPAAQ